MERQYFREYEKWSREIGIYFKAKTYPPKDVLNSYKEALLTLRGYLEEMGLAMPAAPFPYDEGNTNTHRYLEKLLEPNGKVRHRSAFAILNPNYVYKTSWKPSQLTRML